MQLRHLFFTVPFLVSSLSIHANPAAFEQTEPEELIIHNRILAKVNTKTISVIDVMKKMDLFLQKNYPQFIASKGARFQFYSHQWRDYLAQIIDQELMLADAERLEVKVTDAEVREEILQRFGPSLVVTLDAMGLAYDEMRQMIRDEMVVQRMIWFRVNSKALNHVNSEDVKLAYREFCEKNPALEEWKYEVLSIRSPNQKASEVLATKAFDLLSSHGEFKTLPEQLQSTPDDQVTVQVSVELEADEKSISETHRSVLATLSENSYSAPIPQLSRIDNTTVYRIFHLKKHSKRQIPAFAKMADQLKEELLQDAANKEHEQYIIRLRERLGYDEKHMLETVPEDFQPFSVK